MKEGIKVYSNAVVGRLRNRRIVMSNDKANTGYNIEFTNIITGKSWQTVRSKRIRKCIAFTSIHLSKEAIGMMYQIAEILNNKTR
jgi:hypothetical protein